MTRRLSFDVPAARGEMAAWQPDKTPRRDVRGLRIVMVLTLGFWLCVGVSCAGVMIDG